MTEVNERLRSGSKVERAQAGGSSGWLVFGPCLTTLLTAYGSVLSVPARVLSSTSLHSFLPSLPLTYGSFRNGVTEGGRERSEWTTDDTTEGTSRRWGRSEVRGRHGDVRDRRKESDMSPTSLLPPLVSCRLFLGSFPHYARFLTSSLPPLLRAVRVGSEGRMTETPERNVREK